MFFACADVSQQQYRDAVRTGADIPFTCPPCKADVLAMEVAMTQDVDDDDDDQQEDDQDVDDEQTSDDKQPDESDGPQDCSDGENTGKPIRFSIYEINYRAPNSDLENLIRDFHYLVNNFLGFITFTECNIVILSILSSIASS